MARMKKVLLFGQMILLSSLTYGQIQIQNAEDFSEGTVFVFQDSEVENITAGKEGKNQTWDFSSLAKKSTTTTVRIVSPQSTKYSKNFPEANLVEVHSNTKLVYMQKEA